MPTNPSTADKLSKDDRQIILSGLSMLLKSHERAAKAAQGAVSAAHESEAAKVQLVIAKVGSQALEL